MPQSRHPDYRAELQTLLSTYYKELLCIAETSGVKALLRLALACTPKKPPMSADPAGGPRAGGHSPGGGRASGDPAGASSGQRSSREHQWQINPVVLDERRSSEKYCTQKTEKNCTHAQHEERRPASEIVVADSLRGIFSAFT